MIVQKPKWFPTATIKNLKARSKIITDIRQFFSERGVLEVETPLISIATVTDPYIISIPAILKTSSLDETVYLQTSPEYAMKRLLAAGCGPIYQICKAFRQGDLGKFHQPEFTMLEWYRPGFNHHDLMNEMDELLQKILNTAPAERLSYADAFQKFLGINPHLASQEELIATAQKQIKFNSPLSDRNAWLDLLITHCIEPHIGQSRPIFIYDYPESQAALAKIRPEEPPVASRFEVFYKGIELANGFHELQDANEQRKRFMNELNQRAQSNLPSVPLDESFLAALESGIPDCSGVALGIDRLIMLAFAAESITDVITFGFNSDDQTAHP